MIIKSIKFQINTFCLEIRVRIAAITATIKNELSTDACNFFARSFATKANAKCMCVCLRKNRTNYYIYLR